MRKLALSLFLLACGYASAFAADIYVINPNPGIALVPARVSLDQIGLSGATGVSAAIPAQIVGDKLFLLPSTASMSGQLVTVTSGSPLTPWTPDPANILVTRGGITWRLTATNGLVSMTKNGKTLTITDSVTSGSTLMEAASGPVCSVVKIGSGGIYNLYYFYESGAAEINAVSPSFYVYGQKTSIYISQKRASYHPLALMDDSERVAANSGLPKTNAYTFGYPCDFSMAYDSQQNVGLVVLPTPSGRGLDVSRSITSKATIFTTPVKFSITTQSKLPTWTSQYDGTNYTGYRRNAIAWSGVTRRSFYLGVVETAQAATSGIYRAIYPLVGLVRNTSIPTPPTYEQLLDLDENGNLDKISVQDLDAAPNGPDLLKDKWTWDMNNDGDIQAIYQFGTDSNNDRQATIYGDLNTYAQNQVLDSTELANPSARLHDWSDDGNFLQGSPFLGGYCQQDWFEDQMVGADNVYHDMPYNGTGSQIADATLDNYMDHISWNYDLDGDGDMDMEHWIVRHQASGYRNRMDGWTRVHADLGDNNLASGIVLDPTTGYVKMFIQENYQEINQNAGGWWGAHNQYLDQTYSDPTVNGMFVADGHDYPQSWFDSDGDGYCNARIYAEIPGLKRYADGSFDTRVMRMVFRLNRNFSTDILNPMNTASTALASLNWDGQILVMTLPRNIGGTEYYGRPWANTPVTFTDPWGHSLKMLAVSIPLNWDGGRAAYALQSDGAYEMMGPEQSLWSFAYNRDWDQYRMAFFEANTSGRTGPETLGTGHRQEYNNDASGKPLGFYYSPLFGRVHLCGAEAGEYNHPTGGATNTRAHFWDRSNSEKYDCYEIDGGTFGTPDGIFDKRMWYENGSVTIVQGSSGITFPYDLDSLSFPQNRQRIDFNLNKTAEWGQLQAAAETYRSQYNSGSTSGFLINRGAGLFGTVTYNGSAWSGAPGGAVVTANPLPKVGFDTYHANNDVNYGLLLQAAGNSYSVFGSLLQSEKMTMEKVNAVLTASVLNNYKSFVIPYLFTALTQAEKDALSAWVNAGGNLYLINANTAAGDIANFTAAATAFGFTIGASYAVPWSNPSSAVVAPQALMSHYACYDPALLTGTPWIYSSGLKLSGGNALMSYDSSAIITERVMGLGRVVAFGTPDFTRDKMLNGPRQWYDRAFNDSGVPADAHYSAAVKYDKIMRGVIRRIANGGDILPPTAPSNLHVTEVTATTIALAWTGSSDNVGVAGYKIFQNSSLKDFCAGTAYTVTGLSPSTSYTYQVLAYDIPNNQSALSNTVIATTSRLLPEPWLNGDVGATGAAGSASHAAGSFTVTGAGANINDTADAFHFVYQPWSGDAKIIARLASLTVPNEYGKGGIMIRQGLLANSPHATTFWMPTTNPAYGISFYRRLSAGGPTVATYGPVVSSPRWLKLIRLGDLFKAYNSADGITWNRLGSDADPVTVTMTPEVYLGLVVSSRSAGNLGTGIFDNVCVTVPADVDNNGAVNMDDLQTLAGYWLQSGTDLTGDINYDGVVDLRDLALLSVALP